MRLSMVCRHRCMGAGTLGTSVVQCKHVLPPVCNMRASHTYVGELTGRLSLLAGRGVSWASSHFWEAVRASHCMDLVLEGEPASSAAPRGSCRGVARTAAPSAERANLLRASPAFPSAVRKGVSPGSSIVSILRSRRASCSRSKDEPSRAVMSLVWLSCTAMGKHTQWRRANSSSLFGQTFTLQEYSHALHTGSVVCVCSSHSNGC